MPIHHAITKRATKAGIILTEDETQNAGSPRRFKAHWPKRNVVLHGGEAKYLLNDMIAIQVMEDQYPSFEWEIEDDDTVTVDVKGTNISVRARANAAFEEAKRLWIESRSELDVDDEEADQELQEEMEAEEEAEKGGGSVVKEHYRVKYKEMGHANHCGDWLAELLVNLCTNKEGINIDLFVAIVEHNGVDLSKYKRDGHGWQGRLRMTGRNLLAKRVYLNGGILNMPEHINGGEPYRAPQEWMAAQRFKMPKAEQAKAQPEEGALDKAEAA